MTASDWISGLALLVSAVALYHSIRIDRKQEKNRIRETRTAKVVARVEEYRPNSYRMVLKKEGPAAAHDLTIMFDNQPVTKHRMFLQNVKVATMIGSGAQLSYPINFSHDTPDSVSVRIDWKDDSGRPGKWETVLHIYDT